MLVCGAIALGQEKSSTRWVLQGGLSDWEFFLQDIQAVNVNTSFSLNRVLGNRFLIGGKMMSNFSASWPTDARPGSWTFFLKPSWIGITGKAYLHKVPRAEKILNPYIEIGAGSFFWSSIRANPAQMRFDRVNHIGLDAYVGAGASLWMIPELSMDFQANYLPYFSRENSQFTDRRPHQLVVGISFSYWFSKEKKEGNPAN